MAEGHQVAMHFVDENDAKQGKGMLWVSQDWQADARQADFVLFDSNGKGGYADNLRKDGVKVWGGGAVVDRLEWDRSFGMNVLKKAGIPIPESWDFHNAKEATSFVRENFKPSERSVIKLDDNAGCATSYVAKDQADMIAQIEAWDKEGSVDLSKGGIVQRFIEGSEISVEGWFNGSEFMYPYNWTMEDKKLLDGNLGPNVGCSFNVVRNIRARHPKIARLFLEPLVPLLRKANYSGHVDVSMMVAEEDGNPYALEFTPRIGYDCCSTLSQGFPGFGTAIARGLGLDGDASLVEGGDHPFDFFSGVRIYIPPYPFEAPTKPMGKEVYDCIRGVPINEVHDAFVAYDIALDDDGKMICAGTNGVIGVALGRGSTVEDSIRSAYKSAEKIEVPNKCYRTDGGSRVKKQLPIIEETGLLR